MSWHYIAARLDGNGGQTFLDMDLPLQGPEIVEDLSGPGSIDGTVSPEIARLKAPDGNPVLMPWSTAIYAEEDGVIRGGALLIDVEAEGPDLKLITMGFSGYPNGMPYDGEQFWVNTDPLDIARHIWTHLQEKEGGNLGMELDFEAKSPARVGSSLAEVVAGTGTDGGPYQLNWWSSFDLGKDFVDLANMAPFDYKVDHWWDGEDIRHKLVFGVPALGRRRADLRFVVGENVVNIPKVAYSGDSYASNVIVLGAGEGRKMIRSETKGGYTGRLRRVIVMEDKSIRDAAKANAEADRYVKLNIGQEDISEITVLDHEHAQLGTFHPGDEILVETSDGWYGELSLWCRILSLKIKPVEGVAVLSIVRTDKVA